MSLKSCYLKSLLKIVCGIFQIDVDRELPRASFNCLII